MSTQIEPIWHPESFSTWENARGHIFMGFAWSSSATAPPPASYHRNDEESQFAKQTFLGGVQACVIVRYLESPIGPYDELLWIPGAFKIPFSGRQSYRATRAYVSTEISVYIGRQNWNVPKVLAKFEFTPSVSGHLPYSRIAVSPHDKEEPFVRLEFEPMFPSSRPFLPINTKYVPISFNFIFPPLSESEDNLDNALMGTSAWKEVHLEISGTAGIAKATGTMGDGINYPQLGLKRPWLWLNSARIRIEGVQGQSEGSQDADRVN